MRHEICECFSRVQSSLTSVEGPRHALALPVSYVELLVGDEELRPDTLARVNLLLSVATLAGERKSILKKDGGVAVVAQSPKSAHVFPPLVSART